MFTNLAYMHFIRLMKSRLLKAAISVAAIFAVLLITVLYKTQVQGYEVITNAPKVNNHYEFQQASATAVINLIIGVVALAFIITNKDYYKNRLYINVQNAVKSNVAFCTAEFAALLAFTSIFAVIPVIVMYGTSFVEKPAVLDSPYRLIVVYLATVLVIYTIVMPSVFFAKLTKRIWPSIILFIVYSFASSFAASYYATATLDPVEERFGDVLQTVLDSDVYFYASSIVSPGNSVYLLAAKQVTNEMFDINYGIVAINLLAYMAFWYLASCLITRKKVEK